MTIFDIISCIAFTKKKDCLVSVDQENVFSPYIINRWLSMYSPELALISNDINKYLAVFESKQELFSLFYSMFPKVRAKRIQYIKKAKKEKEEIDVKVDHLAKTYELSKREVLSYIAFLEK